MKQKWVVLAALGLILCVVAAIIILLRFRPPAPSSDFTAGPAYSPTPPAAMDPDTFLPTASSADVPPPHSDEPLTMKSLLNGLLGGGAQPVAGDVVTKPDKCVFLGSPYRLAFLQEENRLVMVNWGGIYAFDVASGKLIWHRLLEASRGRVGAAFEQGQVVRWSDQVVSLLDAATGQETWWRSDNQCGAVEEARLSPDGTQVVAVCERGCILYAVADDTQRVLPKPPNAWLYGWLPGNALLFEQQKGPEDYTVQKVLLLDTNTSAVTPGWERPSSRDEMFGPRLSARGQFAMADDGKNGAVLKILDARTGKTVREFKGIPGGTRCCFWLRDARRLVVLSGDMKQARVVDAESGAVQFSLSREGHRFPAQSPFEDAAGRAWIFSEDDANNRYVWPLTPEGTPRKVLDGRRFAPGGFYLHVSDRCYVLTTCLIGNRLMKHTAYTIEDMRKVGEWRIHVNDWGWRTFNKAMTHTARAHITGKDDAPWPDMGFNVYVRDKETPVSTGQGRPLALSPNAKYLVAQAVDRTSCLYDIETNSVVTEFSAPPRENNILDRFWGPTDNRNYAYMTAVFSDDGSRVVVNTTRSIEVTDLIEGYPRRPMAIEGSNWFGGTLCLSSDGTRVLSGGSGRAVLFDAETGAPVHTFVETERFANNYGQGFWNGLAATASDWAGMFTDKFKPNSFVEAAFADGGARIITYAAGQVIRVWDAESGNLLRTIHTGLPEKRNKYGYCANLIVLSPTGRFAFCYNENNFGIASLWSLTDGALQRRYQLPGKEDSWLQAAPMDDGTAVYIETNGGLYRWPGAPAPEK